jgi:hypothetical protein
LTGVIAAEDITFYTDLITRAAFSLDERLDHTFHVTSTLTFELATTVTLDKIKRTNSITNLNHLLSPVFRGPSPPDISIILQNQPDLHIFGEFFLKI